MKNKETPEELARTKFSHKLFVKVDITNKKREAFIEGYKLAQEQEKNKYSGEEVLSILEDYDREFKLNTFAYTVPCRFTVREWFEKKTKL